MTDTSNFIKLTDWFDGLKRLRAMFDGGTGPLNAKLVERVESSVKDFFPENHSPVLMHADFHHFNILSSERGWLISDPKGVIGPAGYEVGPLMMNPWGNISDGVSRRLILRRIDILHEQLGFERERIREWSLAHAILSAWWGIEDITGWEYSQAFAELIADLDKYHLLRGRELVGVAVGSVITATGGGSAPGQMSARVCAASWYKTCTVPAR